MAETLSEIEQDANREWVARFGERMTCREIALEFVRCFCAGDVKGLAGLLADDLRFSGPLHEFNSRDAYMASLNRDPPTASGCEVLSVTEGQGSVSVYYRYGTLTVAQLFRCKGARIGETLVVFDARGLGTDSRL